MSQPASAWQKSLRRSDVAIQADQKKRNPNKPSVEARRRSVDAIKTEKFPKNNLGDGATTKQPTAGSGRLTSFFFCIRKRFKNKAMAPHRGN